MTENLRSQYLPPAEIAELTNRRLASLRIRMETATGAEMEEIVRNIASAKNALHAAQRDLHGGIS